MGIGNKSVEHGHTRNTSIEQNEYEGELWAKRTTEIPSNSQLKIEWSGGNPLYMGFAAHGLGISASGWLIQKYTYDASGNCTKREIAEDYFAWDNRSLVNYE